MKVKQSKEVRNPVEQRKKNKKEDLTCPVDGWPPEYVILSLKARVASRTWLLRRTEETTNVLNILMIPISRV